MRVCAPGGERIIERKKIEGSNKAIVGLGRVRAKQLDPGVK